MTWSRKTRSFQPPNTASRSVIMITPLTQRGILEYVEQFVGRFDRRRRTGHIVAVTVRSTAFVEIALRNDIDGMFIRSGSPTSDTTFFSCVLPNVFHVAGNEDGSTSFWGLPRETACSRVDIQVDGSITLHLSSPVPALSSQSR